MGKVQSINKDIFAYQIGKQHRKGIWWLTNYGFV